MNAWAAFLDTLDLAPLVPPEYDAFRPLICEGLLFFLDGLPATRRHEIMTSQGELGPGASIIERVVTLMHSCPALHKLGQVLARDRRLSVDLRRALQELESLCPRTPMHGVHATIASELGTTARTLDIAAEALAEASVAVVVPFRTPEHDGVLKVLKPGIEQRLNEELAVFPELGRFLQDRTAEEGLDEVGYSATLKRVADLLDREIDLEHEQRHLDIAARQYAGNKAVHIPTLLPFGTPRITAMERLYGTKITAAPLDDRRLAHLTVDALLSQPMWPQTHTSLFHADPHAGNLMLCTDGRLGILDWSMAGTLGRADREALTRVIISAAMLDAEQVIREIETLAEVIDSPATLRSTVAQALRTVHLGDGLGVGWMVDLLDRVVLSGSAQFPADLMLFRKSILTLEGVIQDIAEGCTIDRLLTHGAFQAFWRDAWQRPFMLPTSRAYGIPLSNVDLATLCAAGPATMMRLWTAWLGEWAPNTHPD